MLIIKIHSRNLRSNFELLNLFKQIIEKYREFEKESWSKFHKPKTFSSLLKHKNQFSSKWIPLTFTTQWWHNIRVETKIAIFTIPENVSFIFPYTNFILFIKLLSFQSIQSFWYIQLDFKIKLLSLTTFCRLSVKFAITSQFKFVQIENSDEIDSEKSSSSLLIFHETEWITLTHLKSVDFPQWDRIWFDSFNEIPLKSHTWRHLCP